MVFEGNSKLMESAVSEGPKPWANSGLFLVTSLISGKMRKKLNMQNDIF